MEGKMKAIKLIFVAVLVFMALGLNVWGQESGSRKNDYGKIIGQIIDEETNLPVSELFKIFVSDCSNVSKPVVVNVNNEKSNSKGRFVFNNVKQGVYCLSYSPVSEKTIYCYEPGKKFSPNFQHIVKIKSGQITRIIHKVYRGGNLKVVLVDRNGNKIVPRSIMVPSPDPLFSDADLHKLNVDIDSEEYPEDKINNFVEYNSIKNDILDDGEFTFFGLFPGKYKIDVDLDFLGYGNPIKFSHIDVIKGQTAEIKVLVDLVDNTGIDGTIVDQYGNPVKNAIVGVMLQTDDENLKFNASIRTNQNGYYKIVGLKEGLYELYVLVMWDWDNYELKRKNIKNIRINKNFITSKNMVMEKPSK
jgi:hypothetical protein